MKKTTLYSLMITLLVTLLYSCGPTLEQARQFNDDVIAQQKAVMDVINTLETENLTFKPERIEPALEAAAKQVEKSLAVLNGMTNIDPETDFFPLTIELIEMFKAQVANEYTKILEQYKLPEDQYDEEATNGYLKSIDDTYTPLAEKFNNQLQTIKMNKKRVLVPIPSYGCDPSETTIPWKLLSEKGFEITFITPDGKKANTDKIMLTGEKLGIWKRVLAARQDAVDAYNEMEKTEAFCNPLKYTDVQATDFDALLLPGGHDKGVKEYLESEILQKLVVDFFNAEKPTAAICHGVVLAARSINPETEKSIIHDYKTTALLKSQELLAYNMTKLWMDDYYLTYPEITVEDEVTFALSDSNNFVKGPSPLFRDDHAHLKRGFVVKDRNYLTARWPGDVYNFSLEFIK